MTSRSSLDHDDHPDSFGIIRLMRVNNKSLYSVFGLIHGGTMWPMWPENMAKGWLWQILSSEDEVFCIKGPLFGSDDGAVAFYPGPHLLRVMNGGSRQISGIGYILVTKYAFQRVAATCLYSDLLVFSPRSVTDCDEHQSLFFFHPDVPNLSNRLYNDDWNFHRQCDKISDLFKDWPKKRLLLF